MPPECNKADLQDIELWCEFNYKILKMIDEKYDGTVIVPMTIVNKDYYNEIIQRLIENNVKLNHFICRLKNYFKKIKKTKFRIYC